ncbi:hypothetical protein BDV35DRAFT_356325 [Aspergillus flavus]|uniref:Uncharacterized protein n=1 Tax=Aspergillus flavus TaxID=5059 RepID=A0A5N6GTJ7_ASPFL|nr:hypothetical protein BDV35DRAFT_356325 [Aspergillus flavus]
MQSVGRKSIIAVFILFFWLSSPSLFHLSFTWSKRAPRVSLRSEFICILLDKTSPCNIHPPSTRMN